MTHAPQTASTSGDTAPRLTPMWVVVVLLLLFLLPLLGGGLYTAIQTVRETEEHILARFQLRARTLAAVVEREFTAAQRLLVAISERQLFQQAWQRRDLPALQRHLEDILELEPAFLFVSIYEPDGTLRAILPPDPIVGQNYAHRDWYQGVTAGQQPYVSEVYRTAAAPHPLVVAVAIPLTDSQGRVNGILMAPYALNVLTEKITKLEGGSPGEAIVLDQRGVIAVRPGIDPVADAETSALFDELRLAGLWGAAPVPEAEGVGRTSRGRDARLAGWSPAGNLGWTVLYSQPRSAALAPFRQLARDGLTVTLYLTLIYVGTVVIVALLIRRQNRLLRSNLVLNRELEQRLAAQRQAESDLRESEERYRIFFESSPQPMWMFDLETLCFLAVNNAALRQYGYTRDEFLKMTVTDIRPPGDVPVLLDHIRTHSGGESPEPQQGVWHHRKKDGTVIDVEIFSHHLDFRGRPASLVLATDVTERVEAQQRIQALAAGLEQRQTELQSTNAELEAFTYSVSHDLRAPLRQVDGFARILMEQYAAPLGAQGHHYLQRVRDGARQMGMLVDDLLNLSRVSRRELAMEQAALQPLVEDVIASLSAETDGREIIWQVDPLPEALCDRSLMRQVVANLLSNAVKFTAPRQRARIHIGAVESNGETHFFVEDNGVGFDMKFADKLFGVFQRLHRAEDFEGTGIGLATVQRIIHKHGGRVWATAELDKGARFCFTVAPD